MKVKTTRFGELEIEKADLINFDDGILGFENLKRFFVIDPGDQTLILWLQSTNETATAFPIIEPKIFMPGHCVELPPSELKNLDIKDYEEAAVYTILTIPKDIEQMSANLKAPIIINNRTKSARQVILQDSKLEVRYPIYTNLKKYITNYSSDDSVRTKVTAKKSPGTIKTPSPTSKTGLSSEV